ncbi:hypothetical protein BGZ67_006823 [Mortierella alpina]|nr:hypothetical protein BGZ67_006823 [Mortierella alpina]
MPTAVSVYTSPMPADVHFDEKTIVHNTSSHLTHCFVADSDTLATVPVSVKGMEEGMAQRQHQEAYIQQKHQQQQQQQRQLLYRQQQRQQQHQEYANQLLWQNKQDLHQQLRQGITFNAHGQQHHNSGNSAVGSVDLVDDVWRLVFYLLAGRCKDLGRAMLVSRRFYNLIANDAVLWKFTYQRTVSGSIFATSQKVVSHPLPAWVDRGIQAHEGDSPSCAQRIVESQNSDGSEVPLTNGQDVRQSGEVSSKVVDPPALGMRPEADRRERAMTASATLVCHSETTASTTVTIGPGLMMPSPLILPHHRRIAQSMASTTSTPSTPSTPSATSTDSTLPTVSNLHASLQPLADRSIDPQSIETLSGTGLSTGLRIGDIHLPVTPASTPSLSSPSSSGLPLAFPTSLSESVSQVVSSSTVPIRVVQHMTPTTTLMHHPPAVYWKHQVVEWLEQEKLRCLRLGLFWGANAATSRVHRRKTQ